MEQNNKRIAKNTIFLYGRLIFVLFVSLYIVRVVLNALGIEDYGIYNVVGGFVSMFGFLNTSMANATQRFYNFEIGKNGIDAANKVYNAAIRTQTILAIAILMLCEIIGVWYLNTKMEIPYGRLGVANWLLQFSILSLLFTILQVPFSAAAMAYEKMDFYAIVGVVDVILKLGIAISIKFHNGDRLLLYGILLMVVSAINLCLYFNYSHRHFKWLKFHRSLYSKGFQREMLSFSGWNLFGSFAFMLRYQGLNVLFNYYFGVVINAANGIATQISSALQQFSTNLVIAFKPQLVDSFAKTQYERTREMLYVMTKTSYCLLYMIAVPLVLNINFILRLWIGEQIPAYTSEFAILTIIAMLINALHTPIVQVIQATGQIKRFHIVTSLVICSIIPISWILFQFGFSPIYGYIVSIGIFIANIGFAMWLLKQVFNYKYTEYFDNVVSRIILFSILIPVIPIILKIIVKSDVLILITTTIASIIGAMVSFYYVALSTKQRLSVVSLIKSKLKPLKC